MKIIYLCWVDDIPGFVSSNNGKIELLQSDYNLKFIIDEHQNTNNLDTIARSLTENSDLIFLVDYNLKNNNGNGIDGDEVIKLIRKHNNSCLIIFYSSNASQQELRALVEGYPKISVALRESLQDILTDIAAGREF
jgi:CheY-like chemotaxis protein